MTRFKTEPHRITERLVPFEKTHTQHGFITNTEWAEKEVARINSCAAARRVKVGRNDDGQIHIEFDHAQAG